MGTRRYTGLGDGVGTRSVILNIQLEGVETQLVRRAGT